MANEAYKIMMTKDREETIAFGKKIAEPLKGGDIICLSGELGAGKTTLAKGLVQSLKVSADAVNSPTFVFLNIYKGKSPVYHFDLYRLDDINQLDTIGFDEFCYGDGVCLIEWPEKLGELLPKECLQISLKHMGGDKREITLMPKGTRYEELIQGLK